jgi:urease accessory protein UreH
MNTRIPLAEVGRRGRLDLTFVFQNGQTVLHHAYCEIPFKITRVFNNRQPIAHLMLMQCTAGLFGGDDVECSIRVQRGARVLLTQQSATKVHPSKGRAAVQRHNVFIESGAELHFCLEPIIPFADSSLRQMTQIRYEPGARLVFWEGLMAGRVAREERWQFREVTSETHLRSTEALVYLDRFSLPNGLERSVYAMGDCSYLGTGLYVGEGTAGVVTTLRRNLPEAGIDTLAADVVIVRVVSSAGPDFHRSREVFLEHCRGGL